jgi:hypothetical protein
MNTPIAAQGTAWTGMKRALHRKIKMRLRLFSSRAMFTAVQR